MDDPLILVGGALGVLLVIGVIVKLATGGNANTSGGAPKMSKGVARALEDGDYQTAAMRAAQSNDLETAYELYLRAQQPGRAAQIAERMGRLTVAAELYEKAGDRAKAAQLYRDAGLAHRAAEVAPRPSQAPRGSNRPNEAPESKVMLPQDRARAAEEAFLAAKRAAKSGDADAQDQVKRFAEEAAEAWLSVGDIRRAAEVCKQAGLIDQALNLYVNVLGDPGAAAALVAEGGDHARAAELFESAGLKERALAAWMSWSKKATDPLAHLGDVARLGPEAQAPFLKGVVADHPIAPNNVELHYRVARAMEETKEVRSAIVVLEQVASIDPRFKDVEQRLMGLRATALSVAPPPKKMSDAPPTAQDTPPTKVSRDMLPESDDELEQVVNKAATRAAEMVQRSNAAEIVKRATALGGASATKMSAQGIAPQVVEISVRFAEDPSVKEAKSGPTSSELRQIIGDKPCDLGNIEVYYRLALALVAGGRWDEAREAFLQVEEASPGYRDARVRAEELATWKSGVASSVFSAGTGAAGRYTVLGELGRGGMAVVYRARDEALGREIALKFLSEEAGQNELFMSFFQREARAAGSLNHPNIVTIYDVGTLEGRPYISMEFVEGSSIEHVIETQGPLPIPEAIRIIEQVLVALEFAHQKKIIHRDVKPANIMRTNTGIVKLMDFGLAKNVEGKQKTTVISGTPSYMAPEQLVGRDVDMRADIFAVGASLYEILTGEVPFHGLVRVEPPKPLSALLPGVPVPIEALVSRALEFSQDRRFPSATAMLEPVRAILATASASGHVLAPPSKAKTGTMLGVAPATHAPIPREEAPDSPPDGGAEGKARAKSEVMTQNIRRR